MYCDIVMYVVFVMMYDFFVMVLIDGYLKFWKKRYRGVEFVKYF